MNWPFVGAKVPPDMHARMQRFIQAWCAMHGADRSAAVRRLLELGLDSAARPAHHDERWLDLLERLERIETLLDALGVAVSALPALVTWLHAMSSPYRDPQGDAALAARLDALFAADWDQRCRTRGIPRPRYVKVARRAPIGEAARQQVRRTRKTTVRLTPELCDRVLAVAQRDELPWQVALCRVLEFGLRHADGEHDADNTRRLLDSARRIEVQLDEIGALATGAPSISAHLWRRANNLSDQDEADLLAEVQAVALATWAHLLSGAPQAAPSEDDEPQPVEAE
jgi:hypothetical protein